MRGPERLHWPHAHEIGHDLKREKGGYLVLKKNIFVINVMALGYIFGMGGKKGARGRKKCRRGIMCHYGGVLPGSPSQNFAIQLQDVQLAAD